MDALEIKEAVKEAIIESRGEFYIDPKNHYEDHGYIEGQRGAIRTVRKGSLWALGASIFAFFVWVFQSIFTINPPTP
jgi:hypothetical protein